MKSTPYITIAAIISGILGLTSCNRDPEAKVTEDSIAILEDVTDEDSADDAAPKLMDVEIAAEQYKRDNIKLVGKYKKLIRQAEKKNYYNSEKLKAALTGRD